MIFKETNLKGAYILEIQKIEDDRGFFGRSWCAKEMESHGLNINIRQTNVSYNKLRGTLRGMHYQKPPFKECKVVRCTKGAIFDVIIDLRPDSPTYREWFGVELTSENHKMIYIPEDFAHGYITLEDHTEITYMVSEFYAPGYEGAIRWDDPKFNIQWPILPQVISAKDKGIPNFDI